MTPARLRQLEAFRAMIRTGSVVRAADMLSLSQPAVTKLLRALEDSIRLTLFDRSNRRLVPTQEARRFALEVDTLFDAARRVDRVANDMRNHGVGEFHVAAMPSLGSQFLPGLLTRFSQKTQNLRISVTVASSLEVEDLVQAGQADLGFALPLSMSAMPIAAPPLQFRAVCVLPPSHRLAGLETVPLAELEGERCVLLGRQFRLGDMIEELFERHGVAPLYVAETQNASAACAMAAAGMGVTVVDPVTPRAFGDRVVVRRLDPAVDFPVQILAPPGRPMSRLSTGFIDMLRQELATFGAEDEKPDPQQP